MHLQTISAAVSFLFSSTEWGNIKTIITTNSEGEWTFKTMMGDRNINEIRKNKIINIHV